MARVTQQKENNRLFFYELELLANYLTIQDEYRRLAFLRQITESHLAYEKARKDGELELDHNNKLILLPADPNKYADVYNHVATLFADAMLQFQAELDRVISKILAAATTALTNNGVTNQQTINKVHQSIRQIFQPATKLLSAAQQFHQRLPAPIELLEAAPKLMHSHVQEAHRTVSQSRATGAAPKNTYISDLMSFVYAIECAREVKQHLASGELDVARGIPLAFAASKPLLNPLSVELSKILHSFDFMATALVANDSVHGFGCPLALFPAPKFTGAKSQAELHEEEAERARRGARPGSAQ